MNSLSVNLMVIGTIHSDYKTVKDAPFQKAKQSCKIEIKPEFADGLKDTEGFSHLHVFYWLHKSEGYSLIVTTPWENSPHGLFAVRSPHRPNPIGYAVVHLLKRRGNVLEVKGLDAIEGTPVFDIKPYIKRIDSQQNAVSGWAENTALDRK
jgi:formylmethanofuran dehydrogenase subunit E